MDHDQLVRRINELSRKQKSVGLTSEETQEQQRLRRKYIDAFKSSLRSQLDSIRIVDKNDE
jgi:uncharacterized protein YnzC (UPF0291/DUF896 family)